MNKAHAYADASDFTIQQVSLGSDTPKRRWASQTFAWFTSESHPVQLSFGNKICCLFSTKPALISLQRIFGLELLLFITVGLTHLKLSLSQRELTKHRNLVTWL